MIPVKLELYSLRLTKPEEKTQVAKTRIGNIEANFFEAQNNEYIEDEFVNKFYGA